jgi:glutamate-1-semialdehyde aminotransferase
MSNLPTNNTTPGTFDDVIQNMTAATELLKQLTQTTEDTQRTALRNSLKAVLTTLVAQLGQPIKVQQGGKKMRGSKKKRGGADPNLAANASQILNTENLLQNNPFEMSGNQPWVIGPMPFSAGLTIPSNITQDLPQADFIDKMDPAISVGGARPKRGKAASKDKKKPRK